MVYCAKRNENIGKCQQFKLTIISINNNIKATVNA